jgi:hypothetical protein
VVTYQALIAILISWFPTLVLRGFRVLGASRFSISSLERLLDPAAIFWAFVFAFLVDRLKKDLSSPLTIAGIAEGLSNFVFWTFLAFTGPYVAAGALFSLMILGSIITIFLGITIEPLLAWYGNLRLRESGCLKNAFLHSVVSGSFLAVVGMALCSTLGIAALFPRWMVGVYFVDLLILRCLTVARALGFGRRELWHLFGGVRIALPLAWLIGGGVLYLVPVVWFLADAALLGLSLSITTVTVSSEISSIWMDLPKMNLWANMWNLPLFVPFGIAILVLNNLALTGEYVYVWSIGLIVGSALAARLVGKQEEWIRSRGRSQAGFSLERDWETLPWLSLSERARIGVPLAVLTTVGVLSFTWSERVLPLASAPGIILIMGIMVLDPRMSEHVLRTDWKWFATASLLSLMGAGVAILFPSIASLIIAQSLPLLIYRLPFIEWRSVVSPRKIRSQNRRSWRAGRG